MLWRFKIEDSSINRLSARAKLFIDKLIVTDSTIENCYEFKKEDFKILLMIVGSGLKISG